MKRVGVLGGWVGLLLVACGGEIASVPDPAPTPSPTTTATTPVPPPPTRRAPAPTPDPDQDIPPTKCTMHTFFRDADGDGFGDPKVSVQACSAPAGFVADDTDCHDGNAWAHPGQTAFFVDDRGDGSWDYDCDGKEALGVTQVDPGFCVCGTGGASGCSRSTGWDGAAPDCGKTGTWNTGAQPQSCDATTEQRKQACR